MKAILWIGLGIVLTVTLAIIGVGIGWNLLGRHLWTSTSFALPETAVDAALTNTRATISPGTLTIEKGREAVERYIAGLDYVDLRVAEVMEFERNFYAIVAEEHTGIGAMELLIDKRTGAITPDPGPNMMWNAKYGMYRGSMVGGFGRSGEMLLSPDEVRDIAQRWLDVYRPGVVVEEHADPFYGYYTIHTMKDGHIEGMLGVHAVTGQVWYHTWHGALVRQSMRRR